MAAARSPVSVSVTGDALAELARALRRVEGGKELRKQLRRDLTKELKPMVPAVRSKVKALPSKDESKRRGRPGLRKSTARATRLQAQMSGNRAGVTVRVDPRKMPPGMHNLPAYLEGRPPFRPWRSPYFGRIDDPWKEQPSHPYFYAIARRYERPAQVAVAAAVDSIRRQIQA